MVKCGVLFEVRTEFLNIYTSLGFKVLINDYFLKQRWPVDRCNGEVWCSLWGTDWILKYYLDEIRLQKVNDL
jgi:hypothetical protein